MKRNLLNVALFGLLAVALPASTFVSCKDYDEDFSRIEATMKSDKQALEAADAAINSKLSEVEAKIKDLEPRVKGNEDEIAKLKAAVMSLEDAKKTIDAAIKKLEDEKVDKTAYAKDLAEINAAIEAAKKAGAAIEKKADKAIADAAAAATAAAAANDAAKKAQMDIDNYKTATDKVLAAQTKTLEEYKKLIDGKADKGTTTGGQDARVDNLIKEVEALQAKLKGVTTAADQKDVSDSLLLLAGKIKELDKASNTLLNVIQEGAALRSLVFQPDFYYGGIEAMEAAGFVYTPWEVKPVNPNDDFSKDAPVAGKDEIAFSPLTWASYHLNPSFANVSEDPANYQLIALNREYRSAADTVRTAGVADVVVKDGMVNVGVDFSSILPPLTIAGNNSVTVVALQYMQKADNGDSIITSDYAALTASWYGDIKIVNPKQTTKYTHTNAPSNVLYENATKAINEHPTVLVEWDDEDGINLLEHVLAIANPTGSQDYVVLGGAEDGTDPANSEEYGLEYAFELVGYHKGVNKTSESAQAKLDSKGNILRAQNTVGGKQAEWGAAQNIATVGREPLVRVTLKDTVNKKIVAVGYIKLEIVKKAKTITMPGFKSDSAYVASCGTNGKIIGQLAWHEVQEGLLSKLNITREDFDKAYEPDFIPGEEAAKAFQQYEAPTAEAQPVPANKHMGKVWLRPEPQQNGVNTDVLRWSVGNHTLYKTVKENGFTEKTVYIRYKLKEGSAGEYEYIYLPYTWKPSTIKANPTLSISNDDKIANNWFLEDTNTNPAPKAATGFDQMHANIDVPGETGANVDKFELELLNGFVGNTVKMTGVGAGSDYPGIQNPDPNFVFVPAKLMNVTGASSKSYLLSISEDGKTLKATNGSTTEDIAKIEGTKVALQQASEFAKDILNNAAHNELGRGQTFTARIGIKPTLCDPIGKLAVAGGEFDVKFLRPLNVGADKDALTDAFAGIQYAQVVNKVWVSDWREQAVKANQANWNYYKVSNVEQAGDITTDLNGGILGETKLNDVTQNIKVSYEQNGAISRTNFGRVKYENNNNVTSDFTVRVPLAFTYAWGKIIVNYDLLVRRTTRNAPRK